MAPTVTWDIGATTAYNAKLNAYSPLAFWRLNESAGTTATDSSGNGHDGTYDGPTLGGYTGPDGVSAPSFDGTNDEVDVFSAGLASAFSSAEGTAVLWFQVTDVTVWTDGTARNALEIRLDSSNRLFIYKTGSNNQFGFQYVRAAGIRSFTTTAYDTGWVCAAFTWSVNDNQIIAYYNGVVVDTLAHLGAWASPATAAMIGQNTADGNYWSGGLALVALWDSALTPAQIADLADITEPQASVDITAYVEMVQSAVGFFDPEAHTAQIGTATLTLNNADGRFSPSNTSGPYYGRQWINAKVTVTESAYTLFTGYAQSIEPEAGQGGTRRCTVFCEDTLGWLSRAPISLPLQESRQMGYLLKLVGSEVFKTKFAQGTAALTANMANGEKITIGDTTYTFVNSLTAAYDVLIGTAASDTATNLGAAINDDESAGTVYGTNTLRNPAASAAVTDYVVVITSLARGTGGNAIALTTTSGNMALSGATLGGGTDGPTDINYQTGAQQFDIAADGWSEERTNALLAFMDVGSSEFGYVWCDRDGTLRAWDRNQEFTLPGQAAALTVNNTHYGQQGEMGSAIYNSATVSYEPRGSVADQVVAKANNVIRVPGSTTGVRWSRLVKLFETGDLTTLPAGVVTVRIPFAQSDLGGEIIGAKQVIMPKRGTDYQINDQADGSGFNYTNTSPPRITVSCVITGSGIECTFANSALGDLYIINFQVRGTAIVAYDRQQVNREDSSSITLYGKRVKQFHLPLASGEVFATSLAHHLIGRHNSPVFRVPVVTVHDALTAIGGVDPLSLDIGNVISITETHTGVSGQKHIVRGIRYTISGGGKAIALEWHLKAALDQTYWILGDSTYGVLGTTTRLAI